MASHGQPRPATASHYASPWLPICVGQQGRRRAVKARADSQAGHEQDAFLIMPVSVVRDAGLTDSEFRLLCVINTHDWRSNENGCTASYATLAAESGSSESTVKRGIKKLEAVGYIFAPIPEYRDGLRVKTTIRVSSRIRPERQAAQGLPSEPSQIVLDEAGSTVDPAVAALPKREFRKGLHPDIVREPLSEADAGRLRQLDAWGCADSVDWLGLMFGMLAQRERRLGRTPAPERLRAIYDGAAASRQLRKPGVQSVPALLLAGIERGFLLARPKEVAIEDLAPGAREGLLRHAERARDGEIVSDRVLNDYGVSREAFNAFVVSLPAEAATQSALADPNVVRELCDDLRQGFEVKQPVRPVSDGSALGSTVDPLQSQTPARMESVVLARGAERIDVIVGDMWSAVLAKLEPQLSEFAFNAKVRPAKAVSFENNVLVLEVGSDWARSQLEEAAAEKIGEVLEIIFGSPCHVRVAVNKSLYARASRAG